MFPFIGISNLLEEISSLSHCIVFIYFFALITKEGFLIYSCYSLKLCIQMGISFLFFSFSLLYFSDICKASSDSHFAFLHFFFLEYSNINIFVFLCVLILHIYITLGLFPHLAFFSLNTAGKVKVKVVQLCLILCNPMDYTVQGIPQARILDWVAFPFSRGSSQPRYRN